MNEFARKELVQEAVLIKRLVADRLERYEEIKAALVAEAERPEHAGLKTEGGGQRVEFAGENCTCRVVFPGPTLVSSFKKTDDDFPKIAAAAAGHFRKLFKPVTTCKPVADFRELARELLGEKAGALITLVEKESSPTVSFEVTESFEKDWPD